MENRQLLAAEIASLAFVDSSVWTADQVPAELHTKVDKVVVLDAHRDGVAQMADFLTGRDGISAVHIVSHGDVGTLSPLGTGVLTTATIDQYAAELAVIGSALAPGGDILLWGCLVAGDNGGEFVNRFAELTGAHVAASQTANFTDNWVLEYTTGPIEAEMILADLNPAILLSHFRFGTMSWETVLDGQGDPTNTVQFTIEQSWRGGFFGTQGTNLQVGDTTPFSVTNFFFGDGHWSPVQLSVLSVQQDWFHGRAVLEHTYSHHLVS